MFCLKIIINQKSAIRKMKLYAKNHWCQLTQIACVNCLPYQMIRFFFYLPPPEVSRLINAAFSFSFFFTTSMHLLLQVLFLSFIGRLPTYRPKNIDKYFLQKQKSCFFSLTVHFFHCFCKIGRLFKTNKTISFTFIRPFVPYYFRFLK